MGFLKSKLFSSSSKKRSKAQKQQQQQQEDIEQVLQEWSRQEIEQALKEWSRREMQDALNEWSRRELLLSGKEEAPKPLQPQSTKRFRFSLLECQEEDDHNDLSLHCLVSREMVILDDKEDGEGTVETDAETEPSSSLTRSSSSSSSSLVVSNSIPLRSFSLDNVIEEEDTLSEPHNKNNNNDILGAPSEELSVFLDPDNESDSEFMAVIQSHRRPSTAAERDVLYYSLRLNKQPSTRRSFNGGAAKQEQNNDNKVLPRQEPNPPQQTVAKPSPPQHSPVWSWEGAY